ncbi:hypothetical protein ACJ73_06815, partial [Blastomyces percursus]
MGKPQISLPPDAYVYTTWTGRVHYLDVIKASPDGMDAGAFIMHRVHGCTTDINPTATRAVTKMKVTITQRFTINSRNDDGSGNGSGNGSYEEKNAETQVRGARFVRHWYEKDKGVASRPAAWGGGADEERLAALPRRHRFLAYFQERTMGVE